MNTVSRVWHPFAQMAEIEAFPPLEIVAGEGGWLIDAEGRRYLDGNASIWTNVHGHNDPDLNEALRQQLGKVAHSTLLGLTHAPARQLAEKLSHLAPPGLDRVFYSDNGAGAVEVALKQSFQFWQLRGRGEKRRVIGMRGGYHGDTFGAMAAGDSGPFHARFQPWFFPADHFSNVAELEELLTRGAASTACVIVEPGLQGAAGMRLQPPDLLAQVAELCRRHDVHLIADEVFVAFGRLGVMTVCGSQAITPDFLCLAKGLTAGYLPLAVTMSREEIFREFLGTYSSGKAFYHGHTFTGNPLGCTVALENIRKLEGLIASGALARRIDAFADAIAAELSGIPGVAEIRCLGLAAAVDLRQPGGEPFPPDDRVGFQVGLAARAHGLLLRPLGDSLLLVPPLCLEVDELRELVRRTAAAITDVIL